MEEDRTTPSALAPASENATPTVNCNRGKLDRRSTSRSGVGGGGGGGVVGVGGRSGDLSEENVDAFYKKMLVRAPNKRQVWFCMKSSIKRSKPRIRALN